MYDFTKELFRIEKNINIVLHPNPITRLLSLNYIELKTITALKILFIEFIFNLDTDCFKEIFFEKS